MQRLKIREHLKKVFPCFYALFLSFLLTEINIIPISNSMQPISENNLTDGIKSFPVIIKGQLDDTDIKNNAIAVIAEINPEIRNDVPYLPVMYLPFLRSMTACQIIIKTVSTADTPIIT